MVINTIPITKTILIYTNITLLYMNAVYYKKIKGHFATKKNDVGNQFENH